MSTQTPEMTTMETMHSLFHDMSTLSDDGLRKLADYAKWLAGEAEIEELRAKYGTTPNAATIAAMKELEDGGGEVVTIDQIMAELNADD